MELVAKNKDFNIILYNKNYRIIQSFYLHIRNLLPIRVSYVFSSSIFFFFKKNKSQKSFQDEFFLNSKKKFNLQFYVHFTQQ